MTFHIITIFPEIFDSYFNESIIKRAQDSGSIKIRTYNLRDWTKDKHKTVDDTPYGGGAGMVMKVDVLYKAITSVKAQVKSLKCKTILLSAKGRTWDQQIVQEHTEYTDIIFVCGRYEGVDERILEYIDEEISIGDYVLTGGELGAMVIIDSLTRLLPGVLGNNESAVDESHSEPGILEYPQYTRPETFTDEEGKEHKVPDVLLSGNHAEIEKWRRENKSPQK